MEKPTQGRNPLWVGKTLDLIDSEIRDRDRAMMFIEHKMSVVMRIADRVAVLNHGRKISEGTPERAKFNEVADVSDMVVLQSCLPGVVRPVDGCNLLPSIG